MRGDGEDSKKYNNKRDSIDFVIWTPKSSGLVTYCNLTHFMPLHFHYAKGGGSPAKTDTLT